MTTKPRQKARIRSKTNNEHRYQFRASEELEKKIVSVWDKTLNLTQNITRIIEAGVFQLKNSRGAQ